MAAEDVGRFGTLSLLSPASATITSFGIDTNPLTFGSDPASTVRLFYPSIAPTHALVEFVDSKAFLVIHGRSGVEIDGCRVREGRVALGNGDDFTIQGKRFRFDYPPKQMRKLMEMDSPVKASRRRVRLSMVRAAVIDSPTPGAKIVQLGNGDVMLREEGMSDDLARQDSPYALHKKATTPPSAPLHSPSPIHSPSPHSPSSLYPSLPDFQPPLPSPIRPPSPQKDSLRGRVLVRRALLAEEELEEMEVAGGLFAPVSDSESDRSSEGAPDDSMTFDSEPDDMMMVDSEPELVPESEADIPSDPEDEEIMELPTPKALNPARSSFGVRRPSLGPPVRPQRPSFKLDFSVPENGSMSNTAVPATPIKEEERPSRKDLWTTPRRKKVALTDAEKKAIQERRKSALAAPDIFFAGRVPGLGPSSSPTKLFGVKEEATQCSVFSSPTPSSPFKTSPTKGLFSTPLLGSPIKAMSNRTSIFGMVAQDTVVEESEEDDSQMLLARLKEEMDTMRARRSPKKEDVVAVPQAEPMDITPEPLASGGIRRSVSPSKDASAPTLSRRSVSPAKAFGKNQTSPIKPPSKADSRSRSKSPAKTAVAESSSSVPSIDLRMLLSPKKSSRLSSPTHDVVMDVEECHEIVHEEAAMTVAPVAVPEEKDPLPAVKPPSQRRKTPTASPEVIMEEPTPARRTTRGRGASTSALVEKEEAEKPPSKRKTTRTKKGVAEQPEAEVDEEEDNLVEAEEEEAPKKRATRAKRAPTPVTEEPRITRGKRAPTPNTEEPKTRTRTRTRTADVENEEPEPAPKSRSRARTKTESDIEASEAEEPKKGARKPRTRSKTEPIPEEEVEIVAVKTRTTRSKKAEVKQEEEEPPLPRTRTRTRTKTAGR